MQTTTDSDSTNITDTPSSPFASVATVVGELEDTIEEGSRLLADGGLSHAWYEALSDRLRKALTTLERHFREEELTTFGEEFLATYPRFAGPIERLKQEHPCFIDTLHSALRDAERLEEPMVGEQIIGVVSCALSALRAHEIRETEILSDAYGSDLGGGD